MALSVFPELMDKIDPQDPDSSLRTIENYINYMVERVEFSLTNTFRTTTSLGSSAEAVALVLEDTVNKLSEASSQLAILQGVVNDLLHDIRDYETLDNKPQIASVELVGNKSLAQFGIASQADQTALEGRVSALETTGGEPNVIETVKRNGTALPVTDKAVDVTVPTKVSDLTNDSGYQNAQQVQAAIASGLAFLLSSVSYGPAALASFNGVGDGLPLKACQVDINLVQAGSGTPSPSNVRAITGWTGAQIHVSPTTTAGDGKTYTVDWTDEAGTVYGGTLDVLTGKLTIDKKVVVIKGDASEAWSSVNQSVSIALIKTSGIAEGALISSHYTSVAAPVRWGNLANNQAQFSSDNYIGYKDIANNGTSVATAKAYAQQQYANGTPITFVGRLKNPVIYHLTPQMVTTLAGTNNIWADTGDVTVEHGAYLAALQAEVEALQ